MRLIRVIVAVVAAVTVIGSACAETGDPNDLSDYYGFQEMEIVKLDWGIKHLRIADFNGDDRNDIAVVNNNKARIELLIQKKSVGPGETEVAVDLNDIDVNALVPPTRFDKQSLAVSQRIYSFVCGDLNCDGMIDLAFYGEPKGLYVILQKAGEAGKSGSPGWRTRTRIRIDDGLPTSEALVCSDLNNDGADDIALAGRDEVYIVLQKDDGTLAEPVKYPATAQPLSVGSSDLNGDGINDLVLIANDAEKPIHVRFGLETGQLGPQVRFFIEKPLFVDFHNLDGKAGDEILTIDGTSGRLICYNLNSEQSSDSDWPSLLYPLASGQSSTKRDLNAVDLDGDGLIDIVISDPESAELIFYRQLPGIGLAEPARFPALADIKSLSCARDVSGGDSKPKIAALSVKEKIIGLSEFEADRLSFPKPLDLTGEPVAMELADMDNNGSADCVYVSRNSDDTRYLRIAYDLSRGEQSTQSDAKESDNEPSQDDPAVELKKLGSNPEGLKVLDVDQDGMKDILIFVSYELPILVRRIEKGRFEVVDPTKARFSLIKDASLYSIDIADVDGKAGKELLVAQKNFARSLIFSAEQLWCVVDQYNAKSTENKVSAVAVFDIDGRGSEKNPEVLLLDGQKGQLQILRAGEDRTYRLDKVLEVGKWDTAEHLKMLFAPLTGNDVNSILLFDSAKFAVITPPGDSQASRRLEEHFSYETRIKEGRYGKFAAGDINSDGRSDIIMVEYRHNHIEILALDSDFEPESAMRFKVFEEKTYRESQDRPRAGIEPRELCIADVTGDEKDDLVTIIHDRIIVYPQD